MSVREYHDAEKRTWLDIGECLARHKPWTGTADQGGFYRDLEAAHGTKPNGRDLRAEALRAAPDADVRERIEAVEGSMTKFVHASYRGQMDDAWTRASCALRDALRALEPFADAPLVRHDGTPDDASAFVPASSLWQDRFGTYRQFKAWLDRTPTIRYRKPSANRLEIHAGDWAKHWAAADQDSFERLDEAAIADAAAAVRSRRK